MRRQIGGMVLGAGGGREPLSDSGPKQNTGKPWHVASFVTQILDASGDMVTVKDANLTVRYVNRAMADMLGRDQNAALERTDHDLFPEDVAEQLRADDLTVLATGRTVDADIPIPTRDGLKWLGVRKAPLVEAEARVGVITIMRDVSRQAETIRAQKRASALLDRIFTQGVVAVAWLTRDFTYLRVNAAFAGPAPGGPASFVGRNHFQLYPDPATEATFRRVVETGEAYSDSAQPYPPADTPEAPGYRDITVQPVFDAAGGVDGLIITQVDVTEREQALLAQRDSERRYRLLAENASDVISAHTPDGRCTFVSPSCRALLGRAPETFLGQGPLDVCHPGDRATVTALLDRVVSRNAPASARLRMQHADGAWIWVETRCRAVFDRDSGRVADLIAVTRDVSRQVREQEAVRRGRRLYKGLFDGSSAVMLLIDPETGHIVRANPAAARFYGFTQRELTAMSIQDINMMDAKAVEAERRKAASGTCSVFQFRHRLADGSIRDVQAHATPLILDGRALLFSIIQDNTDEQTARRALERSEAEKALILSSISDLVAYFESPDMRIAWSNAAAARTVGLEPGRVAGQRCHNLWAGRDTPCEGCPVQACFGSGEASEARIVTQDGRTWSVGAFPAFDPDGTLKGVVEVGRDITAAVLSEEKFEKAFRTNATLMAITDPESGRFVEANDALLKVVGLPREAVIGRTSVDLHLFDSQENRNATIARLLGPNAEPAVDYYFTRPDGRPFIGELSAHLITSGARPLLLSMMIDVTRQRELLDQLEHKATHDVLTGAYNRQQADHVLEQEIRRLERLGGDLSAIMVDLDRFKAINDNHGHLVGDEVLCEVVRRMAERVRETDTLARWGGEEFLVVLPGTDSTGAAELAETLRVAVADRPMVKAQRVTISLGVAQYRLGETVADWIARADAALYDAKETGRDRVCVGPDPATGPVGYA